MKQHYSNTRARCLGDKVGSFEMQPTTNDVTHPTRYSSNIAIFADVHVLLIDIIFLTFKFFWFEKFSPTSNFLSYFFDWQIFFPFSTFYTQYFIKLSKILFKMFEKSTIIFPKFLENFHVVFVLNFSKFLTTFPKFVLIFLQILPKYS